MIKENAELRNEITYPRFLQSKPLGRDLLFGESQQRLANTIVEHILENDNLAKEKSLPRIIGIEGFWGSGKSNVVKLLSSDKKLVKYYFFEYDAWAYQEDLQRRAFLEKLTDELVEKCILVGNTKIVDKKNNKKTITWKEKLQLLLSRKIETTKNMHPKLGIGVSLAGFNAVTLPLSIFIAEILKCTVSYGWQIIIAFAPIIISLIIILTILVFNKKRKEIFSNFFSLYREKIDTEVTHEMISEQEPTVREFKQWMDEISESIINNELKNRVIIVYDNMDRLPAEKVKELWSSIHTFFAESNFDNIWTIIPFDEKHLTCAFGSSGDDDAKKLTHYFIEKTFPVVYRVAEPIITDYKEILDSFFLDAFGETTEEIDLLNRAYRLVRKEANIRNIISFINELVSLANQWKDEISLLTMGLFVLCREELLKKPVDEIFSGNYLITNGLDKFIKKDDETLQKEIAALIYGVNTGLAEQLLLKKSIINYFTSSESIDVDTLAKHSKFEIMLDDVIHEVDDSVIDNIISLLETIELSDVCSLKLWKHLVRKKLQPELREKDFNSTLEKLLRHATKEKAQELLDYFCDDLKNSRSEETFDSSKYYLNLEKTEFSIKKHNLDCAIEHNFQGLQLEVDVASFIEYVRTAQGNYKKYSLVTASNSLISYFENGIKEKFSDTDIIGFLDKDEYAFDSLLNRIEEAFVNNLVTVQNFKGITETYKALSKIKPLPHKINPNLLPQIQSYYNNINKNERTAEYYDFLALNLINNKTSGVFTEQEIEGVAYVILWYTTLDELIALAISRNEEQLYQVIKTFFVGDNEAKIDISKQLPHYDILKAKLSLNDEELLIAFNKLGKESIDKITVENITRLLPQSTIFQQTISLDNELAHKINNTILELIKNTESSVFYAHKDSQSLNYLFQAINIFIDSNYMKKVPENLIEYGKLILKDISAGSQSTTIPQITEKILKKMTKADKISDTREIINSLCNAKINISIPLFLCFEEDFRTWNLFESRTGECVSKIIKPVFSDNSCKEVILVNSQYYIDIIKKGKDDSTELKELIKNELKINTDKNFIDFAQQLNITLDEGEQK